MDRLVMRRRSSFSQSFAQRWMSMDRIVNLIDRAFHFHGQAVFSNQLRRIVSDNMRSENLSSRGIAN